MKTKRAALALTLVPLNEACPIVTYSTKLGKSYLDFRARWIHDLTSASASKVMPSTQRELEVLMAFKLNRK